MAKQDKQHQLWNAIHTAGAVERHARTPSDFAREVIRLFPPDAKIVELGCGAGTDAAFFAQHGFSVIATDFSEVAVARNSEKYKAIPGLTFQVLDISRGLPFQDAEFDDVYARLSLHYFSDETTRRIFRDIQRILKPDGRVAFMCKSINDPLYGRGRQLERNMFDDAGHIRHFFSEDYVRSCLATGYRIENLEGRRGSLYGKPSAYLKVIAQKQ